ncbi:MAG: hypothetical protein V4581_15800 [Bacteroidota bacterium]
MTLPDLINYFWEDNSYEDFCKTQHIDCDADEIEIYMPKPFGLNSKLEFFKVEATAGKHQYDYNGSEFYSLFNFYYFLNAVKEAEKNNAMTDIDLSLRLLDYAESDM